MAMTEVSTSSYRQYRDTVLSRPLLMRCSWWGYFTSCSTGFARGGSASSGLTGKI